MSARESTIKGDKNIWLMQAGTELTEVENRSRQTRFYKLDSTSGFACITWSPSKRNTRNKIAISEVQAVNKGKSLKHTSAESEDLCFSIVYTSETNGEIKTLSLIAPNADAAGAWVNGLNRLISSKATQMAAGSRKRWLEHIFEAADKNGDDTLDLKEIIKLAKELNMGFSKRDIEKMFQKAHKNGKVKESLSFGEFLVLYEMMAERKELNQLFEKYSSQENKAWLSPSGLLHFLEIEQGMERASVDYCTDVIVKYEPTEEGKTHGLMSIDGFRALLLSPDCSIFKREHEAIYQDMTQPLSHYYISCSHNTYLTGNQLNGESSVEAYKEALLSGCRCVELDSWDGDNGEPIIYHGHTLTSKIKFRDALIAIRDTAFVTSPYPVILSLENHCSVRQQDRMADCLMEVFGGMLYADQRDEYRKLLPSPEDLKGKILIKNKKLKDEAAEREGEGHVDVFIDEDDNATVEKREYDLSRRHSKGHTTHPTEKKVKLSVKLSKCVNYIESVQFTGFDNEGPCFHNSSFSEISAHKHAENNGVQFVRRNRVQLSRIYPAGARVDSSNYNPIIAWNAGCQLVALNYQTSGKSTDLNCAKFQQNGNCGYVLKPEVMREEISSFDPNQKVPYLGVTPKRLSIHLLSAQNLPKPEGARKDSEIIDPYVNIHILGIPADSSKVRSRVIDDNGFNPYWDEHFNFTINFPELAFVRFVVMDADPGKDDFIGQYTIPFESMEHGYHHINLNSTNGKPLPQATIFVYIEIQDVISNENQRLDYQLPEVMVPGIDSILKAASPHVLKAVSICADYHCALNAFKASFGIRPHSTYRKGVAVLADHVLCRSLDLQSIAVGSNDVYLLSPPQSDHAAPPPHTMQPMVDSFNKLNLAVKAVLEEADSIEVQLEKMYKNGVSKKDSVMEQREKSAPELKEQIYENYCAAVQSLKAMIRYVHRTKEAAISTANKICHAAEASGLEVRITTL